MAGFRIVKGKYVIDKHPESELDYGVRMSRWLMPGDAINTAIPPVWTASAGLSILSQGTVDNLQTAFALIGGGDLGQLEWAACYWRTVLGRREVQVLYFNMVKGIPTS